MRGTVHSLIVLNIGFEPALTPRQMNRRADLAHRHQLKEKGENAYWTEIVRRMSTQKLVTATVFNALGEKVELRQCSEPSKQAREIYRKLGYKEAPFKKMKICRSQRPPDRNANPH